MGGKGGCRRIKNLNRVRTPRVDKEAEPAGGDDGEIEPVPCGLAHVRVPIRAQPHRHQAHHELRRVDGGEERLAESHRWVRAVGGGVEAHEEAVGEDGEDHEGFEGEALHARDRTPPERVPQTQHAQGDRRELIDSGARAAVGAEGGGPAGAAAGAGAEALARQTSTRQPQLQPPQQRASLQHRSQRAPRTA